MDGRESRTETVKKTHLRLNVQQTPPARALNFSDSHEAGAIKVSRELGVLDECALRNELLELVVGDEVVVLAVDLAGTRGTRGVWGFWR